MTFAYQGSIPIQEDGRQVSRQGDRVGHGQQTTGGMWDRDNGCSPVSANIVLGRTDLFVDEFHEHLVTDKQF